MSNHTSRLRSADSLEFLADVSRGHGAVIALDAVTGEQKWKFGMTDVTSSGILTTASDLLFTGAREGYFQALDPRTGSASGRRVSAGRSSTARSPTRW